MPRSNTVTIHRLSMALLCLSMSVVMFTVGAWHEPNTAGYFADFIIGGFLGVVYFCRASYHAGVWVINTLRGWHDD